MPIRGRRGIGVAQIPVVDEPSPGHNGGRSQINVNFMQSGGEFPFLNILKCAQTWSYVSTGGSVEPTDLNSDGYPTVISNGGLSTVCVGPTSAKRPGTYVVKWTGVGTVQITGATGSPFVGASADVNRFTFSALTSGSYTVKITAGTGISNLILCHVDDESRIDGGEVFGVQFKSKLQSGNFGVIRFLNWGGGLGFNFTNVRKWADRKPTTYVYYHGQQHRSADYSTGMTNVDNDYSVAAPSSWGGLVDKAIITTRFSATMIQNITVSNVIGTFQVGETVQSASLKTGVVTAIVSGTVISVRMTSGSPAGGDNFAIASGITGLTSGATGTVTAEAITSTTLNVGGTGAKQIKFANGSALSAGTKGVATRAGTFVYDQDLDCWLKFGGDTQDGSKFLDNAAPPELMLQLCVEMGAHPWFCVPFLTCDPVTDWLTSLVTYIAANQPTWMKPHYEVSPNECWNTGFYGTVYGALKATAEWGSSTNKWDFWVGKCGSTGGKAVSDAYSGDTSKYEVLIGVQTGGSTSGSSLNERLNSSTYLANGGAHPASDYVTAVCMGGYWSGGYSSTTTVPTTRQALIDAYAGGDASAVTTYVDSTITPPPSNPSTNSVAYHISTLFPAWYSWAHGTFGKKLMMYEAAWTAGIPTSGLTTAQKNFYLAAKAHANLATYVQTFYAAFLTAGGVFPSQFELGGNQSWSICDPDIYSANEPQFAGITAFNA